MAVNLLKGDMMCNTPECDAPPVIKGLCRRCYMRQRRHGDAAIVKKAGRPREAGTLPLAITRNILPEASPRTQARFARALTLAAEANEHIEGAKKGWLMEEIIQHTKRPNGSINVTDLLWRAEHMHKTIFGGGD